MKGKFLMLIGAVLISSVLQAKTMKVTEMTGADYEAFEKGVVTIEFREGDKLPMVINMSGDFFENADVNPINVVLKKSFFLKIDDNDILLSFDNSDFKPLTKMVKGNLKVGFEGGETDFVANAIHVNLKAYMKD